ncbi:unnamed protein product [Paramecium sonneborni]|uniref:Uncharacterized protein n=1 Tax=Paramecium sonneborni TaxID=65129 RepID=A0A8S1QAL3_9CILI|nr:unnamed protein product [Paramecium sonneborni]
MSFYQDQKMVFEFINLKSENILNNLKQISFNDDSTILLTIQKSQIQTYFNKRENLKRISSFKVPKDAYFSQLQYLTFTNQFIAIPKSQILISSLCTLNSKKIVLKVQHNFCSCYKLLLNKNENILFISYFNEIHIFEKQIIAWQCIDTLQSLSHRDTIEQISLSLDEDQLVIHTSNGYSGSPAILVYKKQYIDKQIQWVLKQRINQENGELIGFLNNNQFLFLDYYSTQIYTLNKENQKFECTNSINFRQSNFQFKSFVFWHKNQILLIITQDNISVMQLQKLQILSQLQSIQIDISKSIDVDFATNEFHSILTNDGKYLFIWNKRNTQIIRILYI